MFLGTAEEKTVDTLQRCHTIIIEQLIVEHAAGQGKAVHALVLIDISVELIKQHVGEGVLGISQVVIYLP